MRNHSEQKQGTVYNINITLLKREWVCFEQVQSLRAWCFLFRLLPHLWADSIRFRLMPLVTGRLGLCKDYVEGL